MPQLSYGPTEARARAVLVRDVFGAAPTDHGADPEWISAGFRDGSGTCIASIDTTVLSFVLDGKVSRVGALRLVAVHPDWRGQGLFREMVVRSLVGLHARTSGLTALYAEEPDLYRRFGFEPVAQHAFVGRPPPIRGCATSRPLAWPKDGAFITRCLASRAAVSDQCAILGAPALFLDAMTDDSDIALAYLEELDALVAYETDGAILVLLDVVAATIPPLAAILGALGGSFDIVRTLFPPDKLAWMGDPILDDTGLMLRGPRPAAMTRPFMLPPTAGF